MRPWPRLVLALACALAGLAAAPSALASVGSPPPVPTLDPRGTQAEWERLVHRPVFRPYAVEADCRPLRGLENSLNSFSWGSTRKASLHPRLYASACFAGYREFAKPGR